MKALITGGAGFVGSHLADLLIKRGDEVAILDDLSTGAMANVAHLKSNPRFSYVLESVENRQVSAEMVDTCDVVYHLAAAVGVRLIVESPVRTIETNVRATELILSLAAKKRKPVLITSTSEVYGKRVNVPFRETDDLIMGSTDKGRWSYACSKALDEFLGLAYWKEKGVPVTIVRLFNTVGPRQTGRYGMVVPSFIRQALRGEGLTVFGDGSQRRCFMHVSDAVKALAGLMDHPQSVGQVYNVGSSEEISIVGLAEKVKAMTKSSSSIRMIPYDEAYEEGFEDMLRRVPDTAKINALIGWTPSENLDAILADVIAHETSARSSVASFAAVAGD
ncbi:MAG TPA: GDP-mannose 4,6-dehydratase [Terriglobales bacterium]|nr:GDP-mannose 4,6-dehydratase [Terriglobales bacterium]